MSSNQQPEIQTIIAKNRPDYASLFGSLELCDCEHCRSIYSPAAYLVDLLQFLNPSLPGTLVTPLDVLIGNPDKKIIGRRPDLAHIQLSCENTNTTLPYIDLVNEVLESYIAFHQTLPLATDDAGKPIAPAVPHPNESSIGVTAAELSANPENTSNAAYEHLESAVYPFTLPFNQPLTALRLTLEQMNSSRHELMDMFRREDGTPAENEIKLCALDLEALKITEREFTILIGEQLDGTAVAQPVSAFYGFESLEPSVDTTWIKGAIPTGAQQQLLVDTWAFTVFDPPPPSGATTHASAVFPGLHQHFFHQVPADGNQVPPGGNQLKVKHEDFLFTEVFLDPANLPQQIILQWNDGTWEHRAYWGVSEWLLKVGVEGTPSCRYMGSLPTAGEWTRLELPAAFVGLENQKLSGMSFTLFGGGATWGVAGTRSPSWVESLSNVPTLLARTGITYVELIELVRLRYINPALPQGEVLTAFERIPISYGELSRLVKTNFVDLSPQTLKALADVGMTKDDLVIWAAEHFEPLGKLIVLDAPDSACDLTVTRLQHLDGTLLDEAELSRLHRFIRLWRRTGWTVQDLDRAIAALQAPDINPTLLRRLGQIVQLQAVLNLSPQQVLSFWGTIPVTGNDALYSKLFLNKAVRDIDPALTPQNGEYLRLADNLKIKDHIPALLAGLRTRSADLAMIRQHTGLDTEDAPLTLATATVLYRYVLLARALKIAVRDLITLQVLTGEQPFSILSDTRDSFNDTATDPIHPAQTLRFVELVDRVKQSGFTPDTLSYLFSHLESAPANLAPKDEAIAQLLTTIREGLVRIAAENIPVDDPVGEVTRTKLGILFESHRVEQLSNLIPGVSAYAAPLFALPTGVLLPEGKATYDVASHLLRATGWLTDIDKAELLALSDGNDYVKAVNSLYEQPRDLLRETLVQQLGWATAELDLQASVLEAPSLGADGKPDPNLVAGKYNAFLVQALPYFRNALSRAFVKQTIADALTLDPAIAALLLEGTASRVPLGTDADSILPAIGDFLALVGNGLTATYFENATWTEPGQSPQVDPNIYFRWESKHGFSVRWMGALLADKTQRYQFHLRAGGSVKLTVGGELLIDQQEDSVPVKHTAAINLEAGKHYDLQIEYSNQTSEALVELRWSGAATPVEIVPSYRFYPKTSSDVSTAAKHTYLRLHKIALLVNGFTLTPQEMTYLTDPAHSDVFDLNQLPVQTASTAPQSLFTDWINWSNFTTLRSMTRANPSLLVDVLTASTIAQAQAALVQANAWDAIALADLAGADGFNLQTADYQNSGKLLKLAEAMRLLILLRAPATEVFRWAVPTPSLKQTQDAAQEAKRAHKARYDNEAWLEIARPIANRLRESQREALVAYLLPRLGYTDAGQLFEHFLIDVEMGACMQTSRIKQAISSVQLFVQRCRMNLERQVSPKMIDSKGWERWEWMKNYRVWEVNLKVFLYPENWIEPELRDDKSPFFKELEAELLQAEMTNDNAEIALGNYLEKLDTVSQLKICGMYEQTTDFTADEKWQSVLHVFGQTFATPRIFYYRQLVTVDANYRYWTAWEKVPLDIEADEVLPVIWNRRLYLFWEVANDKAEKGGDGKLTKDEEGNPTGNIQSLRRLAWAEYRQGRWSRKRMTSAEHAVRVQDTRTRLKANVRGDFFTIVFWRTYENDYLPRDANTCYTGKDVLGKGPFDQQYQGTLNFLNGNGLVENINIGVAEPVRQTGFMPVVLTQSKFPIELRFINSTEDASCPMDAGVPVFAKIPSWGKIRFFKAEPRPYTLNDYFFLQQGSHAYLVLPSSSEQSYPEIIGAMTQVSPYLPAKEETASSATNKKVSHTWLQASLAQLSTQAAPWSSGRASITATETRISPASASDSIKLSDLSINSGIFTYGTSPSALLAYRYPAKFQFETFFHPYAAEFQRRLNRNGIPGLLNIESQQLASATSFEAAYDPNPATVKKAFWPKHDVDFTFTGAYSLYNWELFFHVPLLIATRLNQNQRFEEAMRWFHYIFDPTAGSPTNPTPHSYWKVQPFRQTHPQRVDDMLKALHAGDTDAIAQWQDLQAHPFQPHRVARLRLVAYQKMVVMKYIDNLIDWGDYLFRQDTIESINQATQLYILAATLLGSRVQRLPQRSRSTPKTYAQLRSRLGKFNEAIVSFENDLPFSNRATAGESATETTGLLGIGRSFYFCIPKNDKLLGYWDTVADRLFKIRHCMNIEGVVRELPLFEPQIDPALLVQAAAQGIDLSSVLSDLSAPLPHYRFNVLLERTLAMTAQLQSLGAALLSALEKRDAEHLTNLRATHETELLALVKQVKQQQLTEAQTTKAALEKSREVTQTRFDFYNNIAQRIAEEADQLFQLQEGLNFQRDGQTAENIITDLERDLPDVTTGWSYSTTQGWNQIANITYGRSNVIAHFRASSRSASYDASVRNSWANNSSILGSWKRRTNEWDLQKRLADKERLQIDKQITAADIRVDIAQKELDNTIRQIEQLQEIQEFHRNKFTNKELYNWMVGGISTVFFQSYQLAYDLAKKCERCYRFERGLTTSNFIQFGIWDSMHKGLLSGDRLHLQLKQMECAYLDGNRREYELTKHYSLVQNDPFALIHLKEQGWCEIELPETLFDIDFPGHYMRRVKSVSLTIPAVTGPYTGINCTLTLLRDKTRVKNTLAEGYAERDGEEDDRFVTSWTRMQAIATSSGQNDSGLFELNFRDERYLPFEGAGVISRWRLELPREFRQFDYNTISDVVPQIKYTAWEGGAVLQDAALANLKHLLEEEEGQPQSRLFSLRHEFPNEWQRLQSIAEANGDHSQTFSLAKHRFPLVFQGGNIVVNKVDLFGIPKSREKNAAPDLTVMLTDPQARVIELKEQASVGSLVSKSASVGVEVENLGDTKKEADWTLKIAKSNLSVSLERMEDILILCHYSVTMPQQN